MGIRVAPFGASDWAASASNSTLGTDFLKLGSCGQRGKQDYAHVDWLGIYAAQRDSHQNDLRYRWLWSSSTRISRSACEFLSDVHLGKVS